MTDYLGIKKMILLKVKSDYLNNLSLNTFE